MIVAPLLFGLSLAGSWYARELARLSTDEIVTDASRQRLRERALFTQGVASGCMIGAALILTGEIITWFAGIF